MQQIAEPPQVGGPHDGRVSRAHVATGGAVEHPPGQFQRSTALVALAPAPGHRAVAAIEILNYEHAMAEPGVPKVMDLARRGTVGVVLTGCTTRSVPISPWAIGLRPRSIEPGLAEAERERPVTNPAQPSEPVRWVEQPRRRYSGCREEPMSRNDRGRARGPRFEERLWRAIKPDTSFPRTTRGSSPFRLTAHSGPIGSQTETTPRKMGIPSNPAGTSLQWQPRAATSFLGSLCGTLPGWFARDNRLGS
jgi:hypothetical protein